MPEQKESGSKQRRFEPLFNKRSGLVWREAANPLKSGINMLFQIGDRLTYRLDTFSLFVGDRHVEFFFELHDKFYGIERVGAEVVDEAGTGGNFRFVNTQFVNDDFFYAIGYVCHVFQNLLVKKSQFFRVQRNATLQVYQTFYPYFFG
jgi:hypothetical protein